MGQANTVCADWRFAQDTATRNWIENAHTDLSSPDSWLDTNLCIRFLLDNTGAKVETDGYVLQYRVDAGSWVTVTTSTSYVKAVDSANFVDGDGTSQELGGGTFDEGYWDDDGTVASYSLTNGQESENEHCFQFISADCAGHTIELRAAFDTPAALDGYTYSNPSSTFSDGDIVQKHFRVRYDLDSLNSETSGWIAALDTDCEVDSDARFRIRYELEESTGLSKTITALKLQYNKNGGGWTDLTAETWKSEAANPTCMITTTDNYADGDATSNLLSGSSETFTAGTGEENATIAGVTLNSQHTEIEVCLVIRKFYDGPGHNADGDYFDFRLVESDGTILDGTYETPRITLNHATSHIGGCMVESPGKIGPFADTNGALYLPLEPSETDPKPMMIKSTDGGDSWLEIDGTNRPTSGEDLESVAMQQVGDTLHIVHHNGSGVYYYTFRMSDHATNPDTWNLEETIVSSIACYDQACAISVLPDGKVWAFYIRTDTDERIKYKLRDGTWGSESDLDTTASTDFVGVMAVCGASSLTHAVYLDDTNGELFHKSLTSGGSLSGRQSVEADPLIGSGAQWAMTPLVYWDDAGDEKIMVVVQDNDTYLYSVVITNDGTPETRKAASDHTCLSDQGTSRQPVADLLVDPSTDTAYLFYARITDGDMYRDEADNDGGWGTDVEELDGVALDWIRGTVFSHSAGNGGAKVAGLIIDLGSAGGTGFAKYHEYTLAGAVVEFTATATGASTTPSADLPVTRGMIAAGAGVTATPSALLALLLDFQATGTGATTTPNVLLSKLIPFQATAAGSSATPSALLAVTRDLLGAALAQTTTPAATLTGAWALTATATGATTTPSAALAVVRGLLAEALAASSTPDAMLSRAIPLQATATGVTATPDITLLLIKELIAACTAGSVTPAAALAILRDFQATGEAATTTSAAALAVLRDLVAEALAASATPDNVTLSIAGTVELIAQALAQTTTPSAALTAILGMTAVALATSSTPAASLTLTLGLLAQALAVTTTPDDVTLEIGGLVEFTAACLAGTATPAAALVVLRDLIAQAQAGSSTPDAALAIERGLLAILTASTVTATGALSVERGLIATAGAGTVTPTAALSIARGLTAQALASTVTSDAELLTIVALGLVVAVITASAPGVAASATAPDVSATSKAPSLSVS